MGEQKTIADMKREWEEGKAMRAAGAGSAEEDFAAHYQRHAQQEREAQLRNLQRAQEAQQRVMQTEAVMRQTTYSREVAESKLREHNWHVTNVVRAFMRDAVSSNVSSSSSYASSSATPSSASCACTANVGQGGGDITPDGLNQSIYRELRRFMNSARKM